MSSTKDDKHLSALVEELTRRCKDHCSTCPNASTYLRILMTGCYTIKDLDEIIEQFACPCEICHGPHYTDNCPHRQGETQCYECEVLFSTPQAFYKHHDQWGNCPLTIECYDCGERHYTSDCPWCMTCAFRRKECKCNDVPSPSLSSPTTAPTTAPTTTPPTTPPTTTAPTRLEEDAIHERY